MLRSLLIKIVAKTIQLIGLIYRPRKKITGIKTILINKADRIGDAIVALPFLLELKKHYQITVLTTKHNDFVLRDFFKTEIILEEPRYIYDEVKAIFKTLLFIFKKTSNDKPIYDLYLDLNGIREVDFLVKLRKENKCKYYVGLNSGPFNIFLDYAHYTNSMLFSKKQILETFREIVKDCLQINIDIPDFIDLGFKMRKPEFIDLNIPFILINIAGSNNFRGPSVNFYAEIIKNLLNDKVNFLIMDELNQPNLNELKNNFRDGNRNISYINQNLDLWECLYIASKSMLYIGADSGVTHFLSIPTNAMIFFGGGPVWAWRPYSLNPYSRRCLGDTVVEKTRTSKALTKEVIYSPVWCRPCFDIGCRGKKCINNLNNYKEFIVKDIKEIISDEKNITERQ